MFHVASIVTSVPDPTQTTTPTSLTSKPRKPTPANLPESWEKDAKQTAITEFAESERHKSALDWAIARAIVRLLDAAPANLKSLARKRIGIIFAEANPTRPRNGDGSVRPYDGAWVKHRYNAGMDWPQSPQTAEEWGRFYHTLHGHGNRVKGRAMTGEDALRACVSFARRAAKLGVGTEAILNAVREAIA